MVISIFENLKTVWIMFQRNKNMGMIKKSTKYLEIKREWLRKKPDWNDGSWILHKLNINLRWEIPPTEWGMHKTSKNRILGRKKPSYSVKINSKFKTNVNIVLKSSETLWQALTCIQRYEPMGFIFKSPKRIRRKDLLSFRCYWIPRASSLCFTQTSW